jgi:hypothetical protein
MPKGHYHRIHMRSGEGDYLTIYLPLDENGHFQPGGAQPFLLKALWDHHDYYGELTIEAGPYHRIIWDEGPDALTDLGKAPLKRGGIVRISETDALESGFREFVIHDVSRV